MVHRRDEAIRGWRHWIREDPLVHPYRWLRPDLVPPAPFLQCDPRLTPDGSGVLSDPNQIDAEFRKAWLPYFCRSGQRETSLDEFGFEVDGWLPILPEIRLPRLTGQMLADVVLHKGISAGSLDGGGWRELKVFPVSWFDELARILTKVEDLGTMIPKTNGNATPLGQRPLSVLPVVYRIWAATRMGQLEGWFKSWVPDSVFSAGGGRGSVEAWYTSALDIEEVLSGATDFHVHLFVADVVKSFDTVDRTILDCVLSRLGLPGWFRHAYFEYHAHVRLRFKLASGLGQSWTRDGGIPQGCPLSMMFIVALYLPWCRYVSAQGGVQPQLYADNLMCVSRDLGLLQSAARFSTGYVRLVWSRRQPLASVGAVLSLLDGPSGCDPFFVVWLRFRLLRRYLALWPAEVGRVYRLLAMVRVLGTVLFILYQLALLRLASIGILMPWLGLGLVCLFFVIWLALFSIFGLLFLMPGVTRLLLIFVVRQGFRGGPLLDVHGSLQLLNSSHFRERDNALLRSIMVGGVWKSFLLGKVRRQPVPCRFCGALDGDGHLFWDCPFPPLVGIRENPEFHDLMRLDKAHWPRCVLLHGRLPVLSGVNGASPWAIDASESAAYLVEVALWRCSSDFLAGWSPSDECNGLRLLL